MNSVSGFPWEFGLVSGIYIHIPLQVYLILGPIWIFLNVDDQLKTKNKSKI